MEKFLVLTLTTWPNDFNADVDSGSSDTSTMQLINAINQFVKTTLLPIASLSRLICYSINAVCVSQANAAITSTEIFEKKA